MKLKGKTAIAIGGGRDIGRVFALQGDLNTQEGVDALIDKTVSEFSDIDVPVNNAGGLIARNTIAEMWLEQWNAVMALNLTSIFLMVKAFVPHLTEGAIVNFASQAGRNGGVPDPLPGRRRRAQ